MRELKTINLKVNNLNKSLYLSLIEECNKVFNAYCKWSFESGTYNKNKAHEALYFKLQESNSLVKTALQQSVRDNALEACKRSKLKGKIPQKKSLSMRLNTLCYSVRGNQLTLIGLDKRHKEILHVPEYYKNIFETWRAKGACLSYDKKTKQFWIHITYQNPKEINLIENSNRILGIDRGIYNIAYCSDGTKYGAKDILVKKANYQYLRSKLQKKGTRSAKRRLRQLSRKEKRFVLNTNHCISKNIVNKNYDVFVLENLKHIRNKNRGRVMNSKVHNWSYYQLEQLLTYKAHTKGKRIEYINPAYTSQTCSICGKIAKENRQGGMYKCTCGNKMHSDYNASINIMNKFKHKNMNSCGALVNKPIVSLAS